MKNIKLAQSQLIGIAVCTFVLAMIPTNIQADIVLGNLDFNNGFSNRTHSGAAADGSAGDFWNASPTFFGFVGTEAPSGNTGGTAPFGAVELSDTTGAASGISYQMTFTNDGFGFNGAFDAAGTSTQATGVEDFLGDYLFVGSADAGDSLNFEFTGLTANTNYEVLLYGVGDDANQGATWTLNGTSLTTSYDGNATLDEGADFVRFAFNTGAGTTQSFTATEFAGNIAVNGFQLVETTAVPEPSSMVLFAMAVLPGLATRRRRR